MVFHSIMQAKMKLLTAVLIGVIGQGLAHTRIHKTSEEIYRRSSAAISGRRNFDVNAIDVCGEKGVLTHPSAYSPVADNQTVSLNTCRDFCSDMNENKSHTQDSCQVFGYNSTNKLCIIYSQPLQYLGFEKDSTSSLSIYSESCLNQSLKCNYPPMVNLLNNPRFTISNKLLGPWLSRGNVQIASNGTNGNGVVLTGESSISQVRGLCDGKDYRVSIDYIVMRSDPDVISNMVVKVSMGDTFTSMTTADTLETGTWQTLEFSLRRSTSNSQIAAADVLTIETLSSKNTLSAFFTNPRVTQIPSIYSTETTGPSLVTNGGFETANYSPWTPGADVAGAPIFVVTAPGLPPMKGTKKSKFKFKFTGTGSPSGYYEETLASFSMAQDLNAPFEQGKLYLLTLEYRAYQSLGFRVSIGDIDFDQGEENFPFHMASNKTAVLSRIFTGSGKNETLSMGWGTRKEDLPPVKLTVLLDNISIRKLAGQ